MGLKMFRSDRTVKPNDYWKRAARPRCPLACGLRLRSKNHQCGSGHKRF